MSGRVFILGAGASRADTINADLPMPLANDFFLARYINKHWSPRKHDNRSFVESSLGKVLSHYFGLRIGTDGDGKVVTNGSVNIEEVLSFLENFETIYLTTSYEREMFIRAKQELLSYVHDVVLYTPHHNSPEFLRRLSNSKIDSAFKKKIGRRAITAFKAHSRIFSKIKHEDSVLSFNWDLIVDSVLFAYGKDHYFRLRDKLLNPFFTATPRTGNFGYFAGDDLDQGYFLKLHGSVNMACCTNTDCLRHHFPVVFDEFEAEVPALFACDMCHSPLETLILPPSVNKTYQANRFFRLQAGIAARKLQIADEIIAIGYSFPLFDFEANSLMRLACLSPGEASDLEDHLEKIIIVDPQSTNRAYVRRIRSLFGAAQSRRLHGHKVKLVFYKSVEEFMDEYIEKQ